MKRSLLAVLFCCFTPTPALADQPGGDWPTVRGTVARTGSSRAELKPPFRLAWCRHFQGERLGSVVEPVVRSGLVLVGTHSGNLYALAADTGKPRWRYRAGAAILHSPAAGETVVVVADAGGRMHGVALATGRPAWTVAAEGGFSASPALVGDVAIAGSRGGEVLAVDLASGKVRWRRRLPAPVRQTAAALGKHVFLTAEDLRVRCYEVDSGELVWTSAPLAGQSARDGHPVVVQAGGRVILIVTTSPVDNMARRIAADRRLLCRNAGVDDSSWKTIDAWTRDRRALGDEKLWRKEQSAIVRALEEDRSARTFFALDAVTGKEVCTPPVLWVGGCQGVATPPVLLGGGDLLVLYRSAYGNWSHGVAPLVALGRLDPVKGSITPLRHRHGMRPPWSTFWGTADECQNFVSAGGTVLIVHQSTLSGFNLKTGELFAVHGERDSWGGARNLSWARNEWNGPARGGVAVVGKRLYWQTGSRLLCLAAGEKGKPAPDEETVGADVPTNQAPAAALPDEKALRQRLESAVEELLERPWAPLVIEPGLAGRQFFFDSSTDELVALARAWPHLPAGLQAKVRTFLARRWKDHPPHAAAALALQGGAPREWHPAPPRLRTPEGKRAGPHALAGCYAAWLYASRVGERRAVEAAWPALRRLPADFRKLEHPDERHLNHHLAGVLALGRLARLFGDADTEKEAGKLAARLSDRLVQRWEAAARRVGTPVVPSVREWDNFIGKGDGLFVPVRPHFHRLTLFDGLTPEVAAVILARAGKAADRVWGAFEALCPTWHLQGEERQVHTGENAFDPPDFALSAYRALAWLRQATAGELTSRLDIPFCRADLFFIEKLAVRLERLGLPERRSGRRPRTAPAGWRQQVDDLRWRVGSGQPPRRNARDGQEIRAPLPA
jgi:outer membrane protein assembly factor BamB